MKKNALLLSFFLFNILAIQAQESMKYIDKSNMDISVSPGDNFYQYANGTWLKNNPVPNSKTRWGSFDLLREESSKRLQSLLEDAMKNRDKDRATQIIADFFFSGMDSITIESKGYTPIKADLNRLNNLNSIKDVLNEITTLRTMGMGSALFGSFVGPDRKNVTVNIPSISQGGTSLPDRDYYLKDDPRSTKIREAYKSHLNKVFMLVGEDETTSKLSAASVLKIETALAKAQMSRVEMRDPYKTYNKFSIADLNKLTPNVNWNVVLDELKIKGADSIITNNPNFLKSADALLNELPINDWKSYLRWTVIRSASPYLSSAFVNADFELNKVQTGQK